MSRCFAPSARRTPLLVGRARESDWLEARLDDLDAGVPRLALLRGDAGLVKGSQ